MAIESDKNVYVHLECKLQIKHLTNAFYGMFMCSNENTIDYYKQVLKLI